MTNYSDNCFLFLGKTGVGKSLCTKNLTSNSKIIVRHTAEHRQIFVLIFVDAMVRKSFYGFQTKILRLHMSQKQMKCY